MFKVITWDTSTDANGNKRVTARVENAVCKVTRKSEQCGYDNPARTARGLIGPLMQEAYPDRYYSWYTAEIVGHSGAFVVDVKPTFE